MNRYILIGLVFSLCTACNSSEKVANKKDLDKAAQVTSTTDLHQLAKFASKKGEWLKAAQLYEQIYQKDPSNKEANYETGTNYLKANYPKKALAILINFDKKHQDTTAEFNGRIARIAKAYYQSEQYAEILKLVKNYTYPKMYRGLAREHLKALIQLKEKGQLSTSFATYQQTGTYDDKGKFTNMGFLYRAICNELLLVDNMDLLTIYANKYSDWANKRLSKDKRNAAFSLFYQRDYPQAIEQLKTAITTEKSPRHKMELTGLLGVCYAKNQEIEKAITQIQKIHSMDDLSPRHDTFGAKYYHQARIEVALKQSTNAIRSLKKGVGNNAEFWSNRFREDGLMKDLFENTDFKVLVKLND